MSDSSLALFPTLHQPHFRSVTSPIPNPSPAPFLTLHQPYSCHCSQACQTRPRQGSPLLRTQRSSVCHPSSSMHPPQLPTTSIHAYPPIASSHSTSRVGTLRPSSTSPIETIPLVLSSTPCSHVHSCGHLEALRHDPLVLHLDCMVHLFSATITLLPPLQNRYSYRATRRAHLRIPAYLLLLRNSLPVHAHAALCRSISLAVPPRHAPHRAQRPSGPPPTIGLLHGATPVPIDCSVLISV